MVSQIPRDLRSRRAGCDRPSVARSAPGGDLRVSAARRSAPRLRGARRQVDLLRRATAETPLLTRRPLARRAAACQDLPERQSPAPWPRGDACPPWIAAVSFTRARVGMELLLAARSHRAPHHIVPSHCAPSHCPVTCVPLVTATRASGTGERKRRTLRRPPRVPDAQNRANGDTNTMSNDKPHPEHPVHPPHPPKPPKPGPVDPPVPPTPRPVG